MERLCSRERDLRIVEVPEPVAALTSGQRRIRSFMSALLFAGKRTMSRMIGHEEFVSSDLFGGAV